MNVRCSVADIWSAGRSSVKWVLAVLVCLFCLSFKSSAADLVISNNAIINLFGDSLFVDTQAPSVGYRFPDFLESYFQLNYPKGNIHFFNFGRSGGTMDDRLTNNIQKNGLAVWAYQNNPYQHIGISSSTDNAGLTSNQMYLAQSNCFLAPGLMSDGGPNLVTHTGWAAAHKVQWIGLGEIPVGSDGSALEQARNDAGTNAGWTLGIRGIDWWHSLVQAETNDFLKNGGLAAGWQDNGHPGAGMELAMAFAFLKQITTDTNISTAVVDWNSSTPVATNHCVISGISQSGNTLTFNRLDDRLPFAWDPDNSFNGVTNECSQAFVLDPTFANMFQFSLQVKNIPAGTYAVVIDGELAAVLPDTVLSAGWNMFTNMAGPYWAQRVEVLGRIRDKEHVDRYTRVPNSASDGQGMVSYGSFANAYWSTNARGDNLINLLSNRVANVMGWDARTEAAAQPTNHTFVIMPFTPTATIRASSLTSALNVPVVLDGSYSLKATNYYWKQIGGSPQLDIIGEGTAKPMIISVTNAGNYTFQLTVTDGQTYSTNQVTLTFVPPTGRTIFVDGQLGANCLNNNYSIANRSAGGSDGNAYTTIQQAANVSQPGDAIEIRGGAYSNAPSVGDQYMVWVPTAGTATAPIRYEAYNNEKVQLVGWGFSDADTNGDGLADGPAQPNLRQYLFFIPPSIDYIQVKGLEILNSGQAGLTVEGSFCYVSECSTHDNWTTGASITRARVGTNTLHGTVLRWVESYHNRHFTGFVLGLEDQSTFGFITDCAAVECMSYWNGFQDNGVEVLPIAGDPQGGGNSGGFWSNKYLADNAGNFPIYGTRNWGLNLYFVRCISWHNCDDGFAFDHADSLIEDDRSLFNGPTGMMGYKMLRVSYGMKFCGNIAYGNIARGYEIRADTNALIQLYNNSSFENAEHGFWIFGSDATSIILATNNVAAFNSGPNFLWSGQPQNWASDGINVLSTFSGDPKLVNTNLVLNTAFQAGWTVHQKRDFVEGQIDRALSPALGSPLIHASTFVASYHCPTADNDPNSPMPLNAPGRHWLIPAPDMGALNFITTNSANRLAPPTGVRIVP